MTSTKYPKYRIKEWLDTQDLSVVYGVQIRPSRESSWMNVANGTQPLFYKEQSEADQFIQYHKRNHEETAKQV